MKKFIALMAVLLLAASSSAPSGEKEQRMLGGCLSDTVNLGLEIRPQNKSAGTPYRLDILSIDFAGEELYRRAAHELGGLLERNILYQPGGGRQRYLDRLVRARQDGIEQAGTTSVFPNQR